MSTAAGRRAARRHRSSPRLSGRSASARDGALALLTGLAANASLATGQPTDVAELLDPVLLENLEPVQA